MQIIPHRDVDMWDVFEWAVLGGVAVLTLIKNIFLVLSRGSFSIRAIGRHTTKAQKEGIFLFPVQSQCYA